MGPHLPVRRGPVVYAGGGLHVPPDRPLPALLARRRGVPGTTDPARAGPAQPRVGVLPHHPGHPGVRLLPDRPVRADAPAAPRDVVRGPRHGPHAARALRRLRGAPALRGPLHAWFVMLTSEYAWGMLGDPAAPPAPAFAPPPFARSATAPRGFPATAPPPPPPPSRLRPDAAPFAYPTTPGEQVPSPGPDAVAPPGAARAEPAPAPARMAATATAARPAGLPARRHAPALVVGADLGRPPGSRPAAVGNARAAGCRQELDDLRHRLGVDPVRRAERRPEHRGGLPERQRAGHGQRRRLSLLPTQAAPDVTAGH